MRELILQSLDQKQQLFHFGFKVDYWTHLPENTLWIFMDELLFFLSTDNVHVIQILTVCIQIILPVLKGKPPGDITIPDSLNGGTISACILEFIAQIQLLLDNDVRLHNTDRILQVIQQIMGQGFIDPYSCLFCVPLVQLYCTIFGMGYCNTEQLHLESLAKWCISNICFVQRDRSTCNKPSGLECSLQNYYLWELVELCVYAGADMNSTEFVAFASLHIKYKTTIMFLAAFIIQAYKDHILNGCVLTVQRIVRLARMSRIHCTYEDEWLEQFSAVWAV